MIQVHFAYAFTAGLVAALNPCGFPMLPAYLSFFIGADAAAGRIDGPGGSPGRRTRPPGCCGRSGAGASVSLGFFIVFLGIGLPIDAGLDFLYVWATWLTIAIGIGLFALGIAMVVGRAPKLGLPRLDRGGRTRTVGSMVLFGMSYAIASLGCTVGLFLVVVRGTAEQSNLASGVAAFGAYAAGMSVVLMALSLALAFAREGLVRGMRSLLALLRPGRRRPARARGRLPGLLRDGRHPRRRQLDEPDHLRGQPLGQPADLDRGSQHRSRSRARHGRAGRVGLVARPAQRQDLTHDAGVRRQPTAGACPVPSDHGRRHRDPPPVGDQTLPGSTTDAVGSLDLQLQEGTVTALVGPSGCGKTTTLKMINRLIEPTSRHDRAVRPGRAVDAGRTSCAAASAT